MDTQAHRFNNEKLLEVLSLSQNATAIYTDDNIVIQSANDVMIAFWGKDRSVIGKPLLEAVPELQGQPFISLLQNVWRTGITYETKDAAAELLVYGKMQTFYFDFLYRVIRNEEGEIDCILHTASDVTERNVNRRALQYAKEQQEALYKEQAINEELAAANEELSSINEELQQTQESLNQLNNELEERVITRTEALTESENRFRNLVLLAPVGICMIKGDPFHVEVVNETFLELIRRERSDFDHQSYWGAIPEAADVYEPITRNVVVTGETYYAKEHEIRLLRKGIEETIYADFVYEPIRDADGSMDTILIIATDVTEQVKARKKVEQAELQLRLAVEAANMGSWYIQPETKALKYNSILANMFGYEGKEPMTYEQAIMQVTEAYRTKITTEIEKAIANGRDYNVIYSQRRFNDGEVIWLRSFGKITEDVNGKNHVFSGVVMDVTEQVVARNKLQEAEEMLRLSVETANIGTYFLDTKSNVFITSPRLKELFGYYPDEEMPFEAALNQITDDYRKQVSEAVLAAISNAEKYGIEYSIIGFHDQKLRWVKAFGGLYPDANGEYTQFFGAIMEITEQKQDEQRKNDFISMVSHELKTPLTSINAYLQMLEVKTKKSEDPFIADALGKSLKQVKKMTSMINGFLNVSRLESGKIHIHKQRFDMTDLIKEAEQEAISLISTHKLLFKSSVSAYVHADQDKIGQVINNLISNAVKYSPTFSTIEVACITIDHHVRVSVKDEGTGIEPEDLSKIFDRYYRVEGNHTLTTSGFGIGLYLSTEIIDRHEGKIWVESEIGKGSTFYFSLPVE